jgi:hypothetical protein
MRSERGQGLFQAITTKTSGAHTLPVGTVNVDSTTPFASRGRFYIQDQAVDYTGKGATTFTGCTGGSGLIADDTKVSQSNHRFFWDREYEWGTKKGVLMFAGGGGSVDHWVKGIPTAREQTRAITAAGFPAASCAVDWEWNNAAIQARATDLRTYAQSRGLFAAGKVHVFGVSMGGGIAMGWAKANPTLVQSVCVEIPSIDMQWIHANDPLAQGYDASIEAAFEDTGDPGTVPVDADNPADNGATFDSNNIPVRIYATTDDPICVYSSMQSFDTAAGSTCELVTGGTGHAVTWIDYDDVGAFFAAND